MLCDAGVSYAEVIVNKHFDLFYTRYTENKKKSEEQLATSSSENQVLVFMCFCPNN